MKLTALIIDDLPFVVEDEEGFIAAAFRHKQDAFNYAMARAGLGFREREDNGNRTQ
jgi:hypothetical protein